MGAHNLPLHALSRQLLLHCGRGQHGRADRAHQADRHCEGEQNFRFNSTDLFNPPPPSPTPTQPFIFVCSVFVNIGAMPVWKMFDRLLPLSLLPRATLH